MRTAVLLSLLFHIAAAFHQLHYLVVIPADLRYPSTQVVCLHITCFGKKLQVNLVLERSAGRELLLQETIQKEKTFTCTKFWVAPPVNGTEEIASVKLIITGEGVSIEEKKKVLIRKASSGTFIQTDKPFYQPGQTVKFRVVTLDEDFVALNNSISLFLQDPKNNRIEQWLNVVPKDGIADLSFQLSDEPLLGTYVINVTNAQAYGSFSVEEYVLPKFEVILEAPNQIYMLDKTFPLRVCGRYPYGKGVQGMVHVSLCQKIAPFLPNSFKPHLCQEFSNQTDEMGCFFTNVSLSSFSQDFRYYQDSIVAEALLVEDGTDIQVNASHKLFISKIGGMALFDDVNSYYHPGEMYRGKIKVIDLQGKALKHKEVILTLSCGEQQFKQKYITGDSGTASFSLNTTAWNSTLALLEASVLHQDLDKEAGTVDLSYQQASHLIRPFYSTSRSFLSIVRVPGTMPCGEEQAVQVDFRVYKEDLEHGPKRVIFSYFVTGKRGIVHAGQKTVWVGLPRMMEGFFSIPLTFSSIYAPTPRLVVYVIFPNGKIIADSAVFSVSTCFRNKVELGFSTPKTLPDSEVGLHLLAPPGSTCAVWTVDQTDLLLKPGEELSGSLIYGLFPSLYNSRYPHQVSEDDHSCGFPNSDEPDVFTAFREMGLKIMSNTNIRKPTVCPTTPSTTMLQETAVFTSRPTLMFAQPHKAYNTEHLTPTYQPTMFSSLSSAEEKVHKHLPQTWIWDLYSVGPSGNKSVTVTVPNTITKWKAEMFCTGRNGFGLAPASSLLVFKPFLVELTLPSSVVQGETFTLKATVFNYLQRCMKIRVTLEEIAHFQLKPCEGCVYTSCLCAREAKTFQWIVTAEQLGLTNITLSTEAVATEELCGKETVFVPDQGQKDMITKPLLVRPEGVLVEKAHSSILCPKKGNPAQESVSLMLPPNVVEGSVRASVSVTGKEFSYDNTFPNATDEMGCFFTNVSLSSFSQDFRYYQDSIVAEALLVEDGTDIQVNASHKLFISKIGGMALFDDVNSYYHPGEMYRGKIKVIDLQGKALKHKEVILTLSCGEQQFKQKYITGDSGTASFSLNTTAWNSTLALLEASVLHQDLDKEAGTVDLSYQQASHLIRPFYSTSRSFLSIVRVPGTMPCGEEQAVQVDFRVYKEDLEHGPKRVIFSYFVTGKRGIVHAGQKTVWVGLPRMMEGFFSIPLTFSSIYAPAPRLVVYVIFPNGKIIADSAVFSVSTCFRNKVELGFSTPKTLPDSEVGLHLLAPPGSTCAVWTVDQTDLLLKPGEELSGSLIYGLFPSLYNSRYPHQVSEDDHSCGFPNSDEPDVFTAFREMGLKIMSNTNIRKPTVCPTTPSTTMLQETAVFTSRPTLMFAQPHKAYNTEHLTPTYQPTMFSSLSSAEEKVHKHLPQTWIWDLYSVGPSGNKSVTVTVPNTITKWKAEMFCTGRNGFGLAPASSLLVFKPFLVELTLPSSVVQGETFTLKATVFNYLQRCMKIRVTLEEIAHFQLKPCEGCVYTSCLCAREAKTFQWIVTAEQLGLTNITLSTEAVATEELCGKETVFVPDQGQKDTITKPLLVRPEGVLVEKAHSSILCPKKGNPAQESVSLMLPPNVVEGSVRASVSVTGDLMGTALQNLDHLVQMPHGCGEQNMVLFAPIVYVLQYLEKTRQLTPEIKERASGFLRKGYQIQLQYQHPDGSYSEFGTKDEYGNTWLTAFVVKCFVQAKPYIFLDNRTIQAALTWLEFHQLPNGCFRNVGQLFHTAMKGGVDGEVPLAAYITAAYLEAGETPESTVVRKALGCIAPSLPKATSTYTQALLAYTFALAKDSQRAQELLDTLDGKAIRTGGQIYWSETPAKPRPRTSPWSEPRSVDVEMTAYVLLALLSKPNSTASDLTTASGIVAWLTRQQNAYGGFASTQDTVVALQALAKYAALTHSTKGVAEVRVRSQRGFGRKFQVSYQNRLLVQEAALTEVPGKFLLQAHGSCCVFTQDTVVALQALAKYAALTHSTKGVAEVRVRSQRGFGRKFQVSYQNRLLVQEAALTEVPGKFLLQAHGSCCVFTQMVLRYNTPSPEVSTSFAVQVETEPVNCTKDDVHSVTVYVNVRYTGKRSISHMVIVELQHWHPVRRTEKTQGGVALYLDKLSHKSETCVLHLEREVGVTNLKPGHVKVYDYYHPEEQALADYNVFCI
ncbi:PREDICTED: alpha-2-macroglobulin-like protein 1 [Calidris pugnax]|uniref:alpha-2-macroglobulin-like protein 1 n=1 Tax=Calidris pugnax TaxID=198806 RepID=UPI00071D5831|nr:PREDICTED: alpha-2-macroglobulin-like protein 1 [Calidris pugnax]